MDNSKKRLALFNGFINRAIGGSTIIGKEQSYNLFGSGNCAYLAWEIADIYCG